MSKTEASPCVNTGTQPIKLNMVERRIASILLQFLNEVKEPIETRPFLDRIVAEEPEIDPNSFYLCDICGQLTKGREGKLLNNGIFICEMCSARERNYGVEDTE